MSNFESYQAYQHADLQAPSGVSDGTRIESPVMRSTTREGVSVETEERRESARSSEASPWHGAGGVLGTARMASGAPAMALSDSVIVKVGDIEMTLKSAVQIGAVKQTPDGGYAELGEGDAPAAETEEEVDPDVMQVHPSDMEAIQQELAGVDEGQIQALLAIGTGVASGKLDMGKLEDRWASATGRRGDPGLARVTHILQSQANHMAGQAGVAAESMPEFWAWAQTNHRDELAAAIGQQVHTASAAGYRKLAQRYLASQAPSVAAVQAAGLRTRPSAHGAKGHEVWIPRTGAGWMSIGAAARAGWL